MKNKVRLKIVVECCYDASFYRETELPDILEDVLSDERTKVYIDNDYTSFLLDGSRFPVVSPLPLPVPGFILENKAARFCIEKTGNSK